MIYRLNRFKKAFTVAALCWTVGLHALPASAAPDVYESLAVTDLNQQRVDLRQYRGKVVLLNFWATWCPPCIKEMPSMQRLQDQFSTDQFQILAVNLGESSTRINSFFSSQAFDFTLPVLQDEPGAALNQFALHGMPSSFLLDREGKLIEVIVGAREWDHPDNIAALQQLIDAQTTQK